MPSLVSILIPAYNCDRWIGETIESALSQTWAPRELIIVDDGSTDNTLAVAKRFESRCVRVVAQSNRGSSAARNTALRYAQGDYIQWLDADDLLARDKLSQQLTGAEDGAKSRVLLSGAYGEFTLEPDQANFRSNDLWQDLQPIDFLLTRFIKNLWFANCAWLVSRKLTELAGPWDERLSLDDDGEYFARVATKCSRIDFIPGAKAYYRRGNMYSLSRNRSEVACESLFLSLQLCINHLRSLEESERTRVASLAALQQCVDLEPCLYPDRELLFDRVRQLGLELGGEVSRPRLNWKYRVIHAAFGWSGVRRFKKLISDVRFVVHRRRERVHSPV